MNKLTEVSIKNGYRATCNHYRKLICAEQLIIVSIVLALIVGVANSATISGYIKNAEDVGVEGVSLSADNGGGSDITDPNGYYELTVLSNWSGTVTPDSNGWLFNPVSREYEQISQNMVDQDYTGSPHRYARGIGTAADPFVIAEPNHLLAIGLNSGDWDKCFVLRNDIDLIGVTWVKSNIIGTHSANPFSGTFDGAGHNILNFYFSSSTDRKGMFGYVNNNGTIKNLGLIDSLVENYNIRHIGSLVGINWGTITNCYAKGSIYGLYEVGGLVGTNSGTISRSYFVGNVYGYNDWGCHAGGLVGLNEGYISQCYSKGYVEGHSGIGGLVGTNDNNPNGQILHSYSTCRVSGVSPSGYEVGGLVGFDHSSSYYAVYKCYSTGPVEGGTDVGGLVGRSSANQIRNSFWDVNSSGMETSDGGTGKTTEKMHMGSTYTSAGWDFATPFWNICEGTNCPKLAWQIPSLGDFDCPDGVDFIDFAIFSKACFTEEGQPAWDPNCDISNPNDDVINESDLAVFCENWLAGVE